MDKHNILSNLRTNGHRITIVREKIIEIFLTLSQPVTVPDIIKTLSRKNIRVNKTTVYREIDFLLSQSIIKQIQFGEDKKRYESAYGDHHHHLVCTGCDSIVDINLEQDLDREIQSIKKRKNFLVTDHALEFYGLCANCR